MDIPTCTHTEAQAYHQKGSRGAGGGKAKGRDHRVRHQDGETAPKAVPDLPGHEVAKGETDEHLTRRLQEIEKRLSGDVLRAHHPH